MNAAADESDFANLQKVAAAYERLKAELGKVVFGQAQVIEELAIAMLAGGHVLLVGVPGLAKTLMVRSLASTVSLSFSRVQFTPDLMPADITGTEVIQEDKATGQREFKFLPGPLFANVVLADEINRTPPKTQAALLEAMQERQVTAGGKRYGLPQPFFVLATQNPIEQEGTYPLPEAQLDRFMFQVRVSYPSADEELEILRQTTGDVSAAIQQVISFEEWQTLQTVVRRIPVADPVLVFAMNLARLSRPLNGSAAAEVGLAAGVGVSPGAGSVPKVVEQYVTWGAGPRAGQFLILGAKARAALHGRLHATIDDVVAVSGPALRHRILLNFNAEADGVQPDDVVRELVIAARQADAGDGGLLAKFFRQPGRGNG